MGGRQRQGQGIGHPGSDLVGHVSSDGGATWSDLDAGRAGSGNGKREGRGVWPTRKQKAPQGEPYGA
jgi:hypothetical protein